MNVNGQLTLGENIADLGGLLVAIDAYHASLGGKPAPVIDGLTGDQRLLLGFAQGWRGKTREDALRAQMASDPHSPRRFRVLGPTRNVDLWYGAFDVKAGDKQDPEAGRSRQGLVVPRFGWRNSLRQQWARRRSAIRGFCCPASSKRRSSMAVFHFHPRE